MNEMDVAIDVRDLSKAYEKVRIRALDGASLRVARGEFVAVTGPSGCGKSTLLHLIAALDKPDSGSIRINGTDLSTVRNLSRYRARDIGLVFQFHNLLPSLTASENVQIPMFEGGVPASERRGRASRLLGLVGLSERENQRPAELSGGERQRVAVARALANDPPILLADEPTGNLDSKASAMILDLIARIRDERHLTVVMVTHDMAVAAHADRIVRMLDGRVINDEPRPGIERAISEPVVVSG